MTGVPPRDHIPNRRSGALLAALGTLLAVVLLDPTPRPGPDSFEMFRLAASWLGTGPQLTAAGFWPPLWPLMVTPGEALGHPQAWATGVNLLMLAATAAALWVLALRLGAAVAAGGATLLLALLPTTRELALILDARPMGMLLTAATAALAVEAGAGRIRWRWAFCAAALAPLARPEGILLPPIVAAAAWLSDQRAHRAGLSAVAALLPHALWQQLHPGRSSFEALYGPWIAAWPRPDLVGLFGPGSLDSAYRRFAITALSLELETLPSDPTGLLATIPSSILNTSGALLEVLGITGILLAAAGGARLAAGGRRQAAGVVLALLPLAAVAVAPMSSGQSTRTANLLFLLPLLLVFVGVALHGLISWRRRGRGGRRMLAGLLVLLVLAETHLSPLRPSPPYFLESEEAAVLAIARLRAEPPASGAVAAGFSGRSVVYRAGLTVQELPGGWLNFEPTAGVPVLISSIEARAEDGGRALMLLEDPKWRLVWVVTDGDLTGSAHPSPPEDQGWYALLRRLD